MLVEPGPPAGDWPRYARVPFPPYRFIPGLHPHPRRHPGGYAYGQPDPAPPPLDPLRWGESVSYLQGIDLYNFAFWWECHEQLEALWHRAGREGPEASVLQGVIQAAAAALKRHVGEPRGADRLVRDAVAKLRAVGKPRHLGIDLVDFVAAVEAYHLGNSPYPRIRLE
jgi:hypothetical protein